MAVSVRAVAGVISCLAAAPLAFAQPVTVGNRGNEPLVMSAPDGTLYITALQHIYRSGDGGANWTKLPGPIYASTLNLASDSSISIDPQGRLYFTFDYPYAGTTAVCVSDDRGDNWACNPAVVPGGTDRMWVLAGSTTRAYEVTNEGLYETAFLTSTDRGMTWTPRAVASGLFEPQSGPLLQKPCSNKVLQPIKVFGNSDAEAELKVYVYDPEQTGALISDVRGTGLKLPTALPSGALTADGVLYVASEEPNPAGGRQAVIARSADEGATWVKLPPIPETTTGTATFTWVAAGAPGHVGVLYYYSASNGNPGAMTDASWSAVWAESFNADAASPTWTVTVVEELIHTGAICIAADCTGTNRFAGDFISSWIDGGGVAHLSWMKRENGTGAISIRYARVQSGPPPSYVAPPCGNPTTPSPTATVSPTPSATASPTPTATPTAQPTPGNAQLLNISGRLLARSEEKVGIAGFIVQGPGLKRVIARGIGPSLPVAGALQDPALDLRDANGGSVTNDNWRDSQAGEIERTGLAPSHELESAIVLQLPSGEYTALLRGASGGSDGVGLVEVYDLQSSNAAQLGNLSVRANVLTGDHVLIDGLLIRGGTPKRVLLRAIGPTLASQAVADPLQDPTLELHDANGAVLMANDNWRQAPNAAEIEASGLAPKDDRESAILMSLSSGDYTSVVRGVNGTTGVGLAEAYKLD